MPTLLLLLLACGPKDATDAPADDTSGDAGGDPVATFLNPADGEGLRVGATVLFSAEVADQETADADLEVAWASSLDGVLVGTTTVIGGIATMTWPDGLSEGTHTLGVSVTDAAGGSGGDSVRVVVVPNVAPTIRFNSPKDGSVYIEGDNVEIVVAGADDVDDPAELTLEWAGAASAYGPPTTLDSSGVASFYMTDLESGAHTVRVSVTDTEGATATAEILLTVAADADGDGFVAEEDCDDTDAASHPGGTELCDGLDQDCDGTPDDDAVDSTPFHADGDGDGHGDAAVTVLGCAAPTGYVSDDTDCDDADGEVYPGATETCDGRDEDCDGTIDEGAADAITWYLDLDGDGFGTSGTSDLACDQPSGYVNDGTDCDDGDATVSPLGAETCDGEDDDCDGVVDDDASDTTTSYADADGDGHGDPSSAAESCEVSPGRVTTADDCDDTSASVNPTADERCDGIDDDCDGAVDESSSVDADTWYLDDDGDGHGDPDVPALSCTAPVGYVADAADCDDADSAVSPDAIETCDGVDDDCDGVTDDSSAADASTWYADTDGDGYGTVATGVTACDQPVGFEANGDDCDDADATVNPDGEELCDGVDNDCDTVTDEDSATDAETWYGDGDGDGYGDAMRTITSCSQPSGYTAVSTDCDDANADTWPGAPEICDAADNDCDGAVDETFPTWYADVDSDGYGDPASSTNSCTAPSGYVADADDCDDTDSSVNPMATEDCDGVDNDCDGVLDTGFAVPADYATISDAIDAASSGDTICVASGTWFGPVDFDGKDIRVEGWDADTTFLDVGSGRVTMTNGTLAEFTVQNGDASAGSALSCTSTGSGAAPDLEGVVFTQNRCETSSYCYGVVYLVACDMTFTDVTFDTNDISPVSGDIYGGLLYARGSDLLINGLVMTDNTVDGTGSHYFGGAIYAPSSSIAADDLVVTGNHFSSDVDLHGWFLAHSGTSSVPTTLSLDHVTLSENTVSSEQDIEGGIYTDNTGLVVATWFAALDNEIGSVTATDEVRGGLVYVQEGVDVTMVQFILAGNTVQAEDSITGGLFGGQAFRGTTNAYLTGVQILRFGDIVQNTMTTSSSNPGSFVNGGVIYADTYTTGSSLGWDLDMVSAVDNTSTGYSSIDVLGSFYSDNSSSSSYNQDMDYCNFYGNSLPAFYNVTDPTWTWNNVAYDPLYTDVTAMSAVDWDLTLEALSPVRNAGNPSSSYYDPDGTYAAIGAYGGPYADDW